MKAERLLVLPMLRPAGALVAVRSTDGSVYAKWRLDTPWLKVDSTTTVKAVKVLNDGTLLTVGIDNALYAKASWNTTYSNGAFYQLANSACCTDVDQMPDGTFIATSSTAGGAIIFKAALTNPTWVKISAWNRK